MIGIAILAILFAVAGVMGWLVVELSVPFFAVIGAQWLVFRRHRRAAAYGFGALAVLINVSYAALCIAPDVYLLIPLFLGWFFLFGPTMGVIGSAWARMATHRDSVPRRSAAAAWLAVIVFTIAPFITTWTLWPLYAAFLSARPALERLADQVAAGQTLSFPQQAGVFRIAGARVDAVSGNVGLMIDPDPGGPTGLVRVAGGPPPNRLGPFGWDDLLVVLWHGWEYREED